MLHYTPDYLDAQERLRFPIDDIIACIDQRLTLHRQRKRASRRHSHETRNYLATLRVRLVKAQQANAVDWQQITDANPRRLSYFVMYLLQIGCGIAWCTEGQQEYPAAQLTAKEWRRLSFGGDIVFCPKGHDVYSETHIIGSATDEEDIIVYSPLVDE